MSSTSASPLDEKTKSSLPHPFLKDKTTPLISTISVSSISLSSSSFKKDSSKTELEILGPVEYIWGQPVSVVLHGDAGGGANEETKCWVVTMLYRRLASSGFSYVHTSSSLSGTSSETRDRSSTVDGVTGGDGMSAGHTKSRTKGGIHSVQLVPTFTNESKDMYTCTCTYTCVCTMYISKSMYVCFVLLVHVCYMMNLEIICCKKSYLIILFLDSYGERKLVGMSCLFTNRSKGYIYDIFNKTKQVTALSFMTRYSKKCTYIKCTCTKINVHVPCLMS